MRLAGPARKTRTKSRSILSGFHPRTTIDEIRELISRVTPRSTIGAVDIKSPADDAWPVAYVELSAHVNRRNVAWEFDG